MEKYTFSKIDIYDQSWEFLILCYIQIYLIFIVISLKEYGLRITADQKPGNFVQSPLWIILSSDHGCIHAKKQLWVQNCTFNVHCNDPPPPPPDSKFERWILNQNVEGKLVMSMQVDFTCAQLRSL